MANEAKFILKLQSDDFVKRLKDIKTENEQTFKAIKDSTSAATQAQSKLTEIIKTKNQEIADSIKTLTSEMKKQGNTEEEINKAVIKSTKEINASYKDRISVARASNIEIKNQITGLKDLVGYRKLEASNVEETIALLKGESKEIKTVADALSKLNQLKKRGTITDDQYRESSRLIKQSFKEEAEAVRQSQLEKNEAIRKTLPILSEAQKITRDYQSKVEKLKSAKDAGIITEQEYAKAIKATNNELSKRTGISKFSTETSAINTRSIAPSIYANEKMSSTQQTIKEQEEADKKYELQKYKVISSLKAQKTAEQELEISQKAKDLEKQIADEKRYEKQKYLTISSLKAQQRAEEENKLSLQEQYKRLYVNTDAQNRYADAVNKLNHMKSSGAISNEQYNNGLLKAKKSIDENNTSLNNLANTTIRYLRWAGTIAGVFYAGQRAWDLTIGKGIEVNKIIENNTYGIAALISANTQMVDSLGNTLSPIEKFIKGQEHSKKVIAELRTESTKTAATFPQLLEIFQQGIGKTLSLGSAFGATTEDIEKNTIKLASRMSNFANAIGMPMDRVKEEMRSLVSGNASTDSLISTIIFGSPGAANTAIKEAEGKLNGVADLLDKKFKPFDILAETKTFDKSVLAIQDSWSRAMGDMVEKSGAFKDITNIFYEMANAIGKDTDATVKKFDDFYDSAKNVASEIKRIADLLYEPLGFIAGIYATSVAIKILSAAIVNNPLTLLATGIITASEATKQYLETMQRGGQTLDEWNAKIAAQNDKWSSLEETEKRIQANLKETQSKIDGAVKTEEVFRKLYESGKVSEEQYNKVLALKQKTIAENENLVNSYKSALTDTQDYNNSKKQADEILKGQKQAGDLLANYKDHTEEIKKDTEEVLKAKGKEFELQDEITNKTKEKTELEKTLKIQLEQQAKVVAKDGKENAFLTAKIEETKKGILNKDTLISLKQKEINERTTKASEQESSKEESRKNKLIEQNKKYSEQQAIKAEIALIESGNYSEQKLQLTLSELKLNSLATEYGYLTNIEEKEKVRLEVLKEGLRYDELLTKEKEKQNAFSNYKKYLTTTGLDQESANQLIEGLRISYKGDDSSLADIDRLAEKIQKELDKKDLTLNIKFQGFDDISESIASVGNSFQEMRDAQAKYDKESKSLVENPIKLKQAQLDLADTTISSYSSMVGAVASFYDEDDSRREKQLEIQKFMNATKMAMQLAELAQVTTIEGTKQTLYGTTALANALTAPFPANIPAFAMVAGMLASIGIMLGGNTKTSISSDSFSSMITNEGVGSVLGDTEAQSESIENALSILEDFAQPQYQTLLSMNKYLKNISDNISGVTALLIQSGGFAFGEGYEGFDTGYKNNLNIGTGSGSGLLLNPLNDLISKIPVIGQVNGLLGSVVGKVVGGLFGKTKVSQSLTDSGIYFADTLLSAAIKEFNGEAYQTIATTVTKKSWFSKSSSTSIQSYFEDLDSETERQFSLVLKGLYDTTLSAGEALDANSEALESSLDKFKVSIGKISLKGKTGDEIQETLTAVFGKIGDDITKELFPLLTGFQKIGEGLFTTMSRVATGIEEAEYYINRLGKSFEDLTYTQIINQQGDIGFEALLQSIIATDEATYGLNNNVVQIIGSLDSTAEELYTVYTSLDTLRETLKFLKTDTEAISFASIRGAGSLEALASGISSYIENFLTEEEQLAYSTTLLIKEFNKLDIALPTSKDGFKSLLESIDKTTESGQELYGSLIILSESFAETADKTDESIAQLTESLKTNKESFKEILYGVVEIGDTFLAVISSIDNSINDLLGNVSGSNSVDSAIQNYWKKRKEIDELTVKGSNISTAEAERLKTLESELGAISKTVQSGFVDNRNITKDLVTDMSSLKSNLNLSNQVLQVDIVNGLGDLLGLNEQQMTQLKTSLADQKITNTELNSIKNLTQTQKDGILEFANNSDYFSTESTLSSLNEYAKAQLALMKQTQEAETESLSKNTFAYGDYIGTQEKIDIAKTLGVSYDAAQPLIGKLQALSISANPTADIQSILGYKEGATSYDKTTASQISALSPYINIDTSSIISNLDSKVAENLNAENQKKEFERNKAEFNLKYNNALSIYNKEKTESSQYLDAIYGANYHYADGVKLKKENISAGEIASVTPYEWVYGGKAAQVAINSIWANYRKEAPETIEAYKTVELLNKEKILKGFSLGGYTGDGGKYELAGFTHRKEYVVNSEKLNAIGGVQALERLLNSKIYESQMPKIANNNSYYGNYNNNNDTITTLKAIEQRLQKIEVTNKNIADSTEQLAYQEVV